MQPFTLLTCAILFGSLPNLCNSAQHAIRNHIIEENIPSFPVGTVLVAHPQKGSDLLWATTHRLHNRNTGAEFAFPKSGFLCKRIVWSPDQECLLVLGDPADDETSLITEAYVLETRSLRLVHHLKTSVVWWQGSQYAYLDEDSEPQRIISSAGKSYRIPSDLEICAADPHDGYLLGATVLKERNPEYGPAYRLHLWKLTSRGRLQRLRVVGKAYFDPGSSGVPRAFGRVGKRVIFGEPHGGAFETLTIAKGKRMTDLSLGRGKPFLQSERGPYRAGNCLFGLVRLVRLSNQPRQEAYLYRISDHAMSLTKIGKGIVFVYYDPMRRAIGLGSADTSGVVVRYLPVKITKRKYSSKTRLRYNRR